MHSLPTIVVMNMTPEQRKEYNLQERARQDARKLRIQQSNRKFQALVGLAIFASGFVSLFIFAINV